MRPTRLSVFLFSILTVSSFLSILRPILIIPVIAADILLFLIMIFEHTFFLKKSSVTIHRKIPKKLSIAQKNSIILMINNFSSKKLKISVKDSVPDTFSCMENNVTITLKPFTRKKIEYSVIPEKRGEFFFGDIFVRIRFENGFSVRSFMIPGKARARIYPNLLGIGKYEKVARAKHLANYGIHTFRLRGSGREFEKLKEYQKDDEYRSISWKATAKKGYPIVKEFQIEKSQNVLVCLNCGRSMIGSAGKYPKFEYALNATLMLSYLCQRFGDKVGLCLFAENIKNFIPIKHGKSQINRIIETLYKVEPGMIFVDYIELVKYLALKNIKRSLIIIFTDLFDEEQSRHILASIPLLRPRHVVLCVSLKDSALRERLHADISTTDDTFKYIASYELSKERDLMAKKLIDKGILVLDEEANNLSVSLINKYIDIKSRHIL